MKECPKCHELNSESARECFSCHEPFPDMANLPEKKICRQCGAVFNKNTVVCPNCQIQLSPYSSDIANAKPVKKKTKNKDIIITLAIVAVVIFFIVLLPAMISGTIKSDNRKATSPTTGRTKTTTSATTEVQKTEITTEPFISKPYTALNKVDSDKKLFSFNTKEFIDALSEVYMSDEDKELFVQNESSNYEQYKTLGGTTITVYHDSATGNVTYINLLNNAISDEGSNDVSFLFGNTLVVLDPTNSSLDGERLINALCLAENGHISGSRLTNQVTNCGITFEMKIEQHPYYDEYSFNIYPENFEYSELTASKKEVTEGKLYDLLDTLAPKAKIYTYDTETDRTDVNLYFNSGDLQKDMMLYVIVASKVVQEIPGSYYFSGFSSNKSLGCDLMIMPSDKSSLSCLPIITSAENRNLFYMVYYAEDYLHTIDYDKQ